MDSPNIPPPNSSRCSSPDQSPRFSARDLSDKLSEILTMTSAFQDGNIQDSASSETPAESSPPPPPSGSPEPVEGAWIAPWIGGNKIKEYFQSLEQGDAYATLILIAASRDRKTKDSASSETPTESSRRPLPWGSPSSENVALKAAMSIDDEMEEFFESLERDGVDETEIELMEDAALMFTNVTYSNGDFSVLINQRKERGKRNGQPFEEEIEEALKEMAEAEKNSRRR